MNDAEVCAMRQAYAAGILRVLTLRLKKSEERDVPRST
jgi:hypothetical protein